MNVIRDRLGKKEETELGTDETVESIHSQLTPITWKKGVKKGQTIRKRTKVW